MEPPWIVHPELERGSIGWRMGYAEDTYNRFYRWFSALSTKQQAAYAGDYPEPLSWEGFYSAIEKHPWR